MMTNILCMRDVMRAFVTLPRSREYRRAAGAAARAPGEAARTQSGTCAGDTAADCLLTREPTRGRQALPIPVINTGSSAEDTEECEKVVFRELLLLPW